MNDSTSLGDTIRDRRLALGYSLGQLATKVNKTASSIRAWERGDALPSVEESEELAAALDLDAALLAELLEPAKVWESGEVEEVDVNDPWTEGDEEPQSSQDSVAAAAAVVVAAEVEVEGDLPADSADLEASDAAAPEAEPEPEETVQADAAPAPEAEREPEPAPTAEPDAGTDAIADSRSSPDPDEFAEMFEAKTEAVPVVPASSVAVAQPRTDPMLSTATVQPVETRSDNPVVAAWDDLRALYHRIFDPRRRWIYRVRFVLILIVFFIMLRVLAWAGGNLFDALGEVLDSVSFSPGETPDVEN